MPESTVQGAKGAEKFARAFIRGKIDPAAHPEVLNLACEHLELRSRLVTLESMWGFRLPVVFIVAIFGFSAVLASVAVGIAVERLAQCQEVEETP